ncbi:hypothetical protein MHYP_G00212570 [Metynnis hypsauchen]
MMKHITLSELKQWLTLATPITANVPDSGVLAHHSSLAHIAAGIHATMNCSLHLFSLCWTPRVFKTRCDCSHNWTLQGFWKHSTPTWY